MATLLVLRRLLPEVQVLVQESDYIVHRSKVAEKTFPNRSGDAEAGGMFRRRSVTSA